MFHKCAACLLMGEDSHQQADVQELAADVEIDRGQFGRQALRPVSAAGISHVMTATMALALLVRCHTVMEPPRKPPSMSTVAASAESQE
mmetsp:Transcript_8275/g.19467  ORF Transcript_8275/g.19467 Transcript_8275/m.19467 type:complete len:89 (-) Transcript_8275:80-346(-)